MTQSHDHDHAHHDHHHGHSHHGHSHAPASYDRAFAFGVSLNLGFVVAEVVFGLIAGSLALVADAGHNMADVLGLALAWAATHLGKRRPSRRRTYGLRRSSILAALANAVVLLIGVGAIAVEAIRRLMDPAPIETGVVIWVAAAGILVNGVTAALFARGRENDINIRAAFTHLAGDALIALGVVIAGIAIRLTGMTWLDPAAGLAISLFITLGTWGILRESLDLALDAVPSAVDPEAVIRFLAGLDGVTEVHDLHIWAMSTTEIALTAHLVRPCGGPHDLLLCEIERELKSRFAIGHATCQIEQGEADCALAPEEVV